MSPYLGIAESHDSTDFELNACNTMSPYLGIVESHDNTDLELNACNAMSPYLGIVESHEKTDLEMNACNAMSPYLSTVVQKKGIMQVNNKTVITIDHATQWWTDCRTVCAFVFNKGRWSLKKM